MLRLAKAHGNMFFCRARRLRLRGADSVCIRGCTVVLALLASLTLREAAGQDARTLIEVLRARAEAVETFQAKMMVTNRPGPDFDAARRDDDLFEQYLVRQGKWTAEQLEQRREARKRPFRATGETLDYLARRNGELRMERFVDHGRQEPNMRITSIWTGDRWKDFAPAGGFVDGNTVPAMSVDKQSGVHPKAEVARGNAIPLSPGLQLALSIGDEDKRTRFPEGQIAWDDLLARLPLERAVAGSAALPGDGRTLPTLELWPRGPRKGILSKEGTPIARLRVWFDPAHDYCPVRLESDLLRDEAEPLYVHYHVVQWSDLTRLPGGFVQPLHCAQHWFDIISLPREDGSGELTPGKAYDIKITDIAMSEVQINEPLGDDAFTFTPPAGTNVRDEIVGYTYLVGSAGEELQKRAIEARQSAEPARPRGWSAWTKTLLVSTGVFAVIALVYTAWRVRRRVRAKSK